MPLNYKEILLSALQAIIHHKYLWFFGLFAAFLSGSVGYSINNEDFLVSWQRLKSTGIFDWSFFANASEVAQTDPSGFVIRVVILIAVALLGLFILWLAAVSQGAAVHAAERIFRQKPTDFSGALATGREHFWPVIFLRLGERIVAVALLAFVLLSGFALFSISEHVMVRMAYYISALIVVIAIFLLTLGVRYAVVYQVVKNLRFIDALRSGFWLLRRNTLTSIEAGLVLLLVTFVAGFGILILVAAVAIPFIFLLFIFAKLAITVGTVFLLIAGIVVLFVLIILTGGIIGGFTEVYWTFVFLHVAKDEPRSYLGYLIRGTRGAA